MDAKASEDTGLKPKSDGNILDAGDGRVTFIRSMHIFSWLPRSVLKDTNAFISVGN